MTLSLHNLAAYAPLLVLTAFAAVTDVRRRRIPNWLTLVVIVSGIAQSFTAFAVSTASQSLLGFAAGFGVTFVLYALGARGAGDVKLTAGIGAWIGPVPILIVLAAAALVSMVLALIQSAMHGKLVQLFR